MVEGFPLTRPNSKSRTRTRRTHSQTSHRGSSITTHPRTTQSYQGRRKEEVGEEEHEEEVGVSKEEEEEEERKREGELSSSRGGGRVDVESRERKKDKKVAKEEEVVAQVAIWRAALMPVSHFQLRLMPPVSGFAENAVS